jgi:O-antigen/teichoic acid export membrane protein
MLLIPRWGIAGAVAATVVGYGLPQIVLYLVLQRRFPIQYPIGAILIAMGVQFLLLSAGLLVPSVFFPVRVALKGMLMAVMLGALVATGLIKYGEVSQAPRLVAQAWRKFAARTG